tara:strand:- start:85173 stop:85346 length:174 start_codon:yes stop_codon:yes gene_type:complete
MIGVFKVIATKGVFFFWRDFCGVEESEYYCIFSFFKRCGKCPFFFKNPEKYEGYDAK